METSGNSEEIIILSDDEDEKDSSCLIVEVEAAKKTDCVLPASSRDEDLVVTFSRRADVLPHARYDCPVHPFTPAECETNAPVAHNQLICDQCFCYICDKLASSCGMWCQSGRCHCNSHNKSDFWKSIRNGALLGDLQRFNLTLSEVDHHLRNADTMLQSFRLELSALFLSITLDQSRLPDYKMNQQELDARYGSVFEHVTAFLNKANKQNSQAAAIMNLGAAEEFMRQFQVLGFMGSSSTTIFETILMLLHRVLSEVQRLMVMSAITPAFMHKLQFFYQKRICFPAEMRYLKNSLCVRPWEDVLLVSVLKGQNVTGIRRDKGKKDVLSETISVVLLRSELLQHQSRYRELCRYLRVVLTDNPKLFQPIQDLIPFFLCKMGDFASALKLLFPSSTCPAPASRFSAAIFLLYLRIFSTATAPKLTVTQPEQLCFSDASWEPIKDAVPLKPPELVKFGLKVQRRSLPVYLDPQCWTTLLKDVCLSTALPEPPNQFLNKMQECVPNLLRPHTIQIPASFYAVYPEHALLLLLTGALAIRILQCPFRPVLPLFKAYEDNLWAFHWLCDSLSSSEDHLNAFFKDLSQEVSNTPGITLDFTFKPSRQNYPKLRP
ncbi:uncharacterized protein V3H82_025793 [Fundulus diaphanus]